MKTILALLAVLIGALSIAPAQAAGPLVRRLIWHDEFNGAALDRRCWRPETSRPSNNADELQRFTDKDKNVYLKSGSLWIAAYKEATGQGAERRNYTSAQISTVDAAYWTYGYYEARIRSPKGPGSFPAFWMMPQHNEFGWWPNSGELDIWEYIGRDPNIVYAALHYKGDDWKGGVLRMPRPLYERFHTYGFEWLPHRMRWFVDGVLMWEKTSWKTPEPSRPLAPFDTPFFLIFNLSIGGKWPHPPTVATRWPLKLEVDYVRVYALDGVKDPRPRVITPEQMKDASLCPVHGPGGSLLVGTLSPMGPPKPAAASALKTIAPGNPKPKPRG